MVYREPGIPRDVPEETAAEREAKATARALMRALRLRERRELVRARAWRLAILVAWVGVAIELGVRFHMVGVFAGLEPISLYLLVHLWRRPATRLATRLLWTPFVLVPLYGPIAYGAVYDPQRTA